MAQMRALLSAAFAGTVLSIQASITTNPLSKAIDLLKDLEGKLNRDAGAEGSDYEKYMAWCKTTAQDKGFEIDTETGNVATLTAAVERAGAGAERAASLVDDLASSIAASEADLKAATAVRNKETADFKAVEQDLLESIDVLTRAISILSKEAAKNPALLQQASDNGGLDSLAQALSAVVDAAAFKNADKKRLVALVQAQQSSEADEDDLGAPAGAVYKTHSGDVIGLLEDLKAKALAELDEARKEEAAAQHNFEMLKQSLEDQIEAETKGMEDQKAAGAAAQGAGAQAQANLKEAKADLAAAQEAKAIAAQQCAAVTAAHEETVRNRAEELRALQGAIAALTSSGSTAASGRVYGFLQTSSRLHSASDFKGAELLAMVQKLAKVQHSAALSQLAARIGAELRASAFAGQDPFGKVKGLIRELIDRLSSEAAAEASEKAYCDSEAAKTAAKKAELEALIEKLTSRIDTATAESATAAEEQRAAEAALAANQKEQAEMDALRAEEHANYLAVKADLEAGIAGVANAIQVLRAYYGGAAFVQQPKAPETHQAASGNGNAILGLLEVVESDFSKSLAAAEAEEQTSADAYDRNTQENKVEAAALQEKAAFNGRAQKRLAKVISENGADKAAAAEELAAVDAYAKKLEARCVARAETYAARKSRREAEIAGLKEALAFLSGESLLQRTRRARIQAH